MSNIKYSWKIIENNPEYMTIEETLKYPEEVSFMHDAVSEMMFNNGSLAKKIVPIVEYCAVQEMNKEAVKAPRIQKVWLPQQIASEKMVYS